MADSKKKTHKWDRIADDTLKCRQCGLAATPRQVRSGGLGPCDPPPKTMLVCARCGAIWKKTGSPAVCSVCKQISHPIVVEKRKARNV